MVLIVSEESGIISHAEDGKLHRRLSREELAELLDEFYRPVEKKENKGIFSFLRMLKQSENTDGVKKSEDIKKGANN